MTGIIAGCQASESIIRQGNTGNTGNLTLMANGKDFVRQGFLAKDGWQIEFDRLKVSVSQVIAYELNSDHIQDGKNNIKSQP